MRDDNERLLDGTLPDNPFDDAIPIGKPNIKASAPDYEPFPVDALPEPVKSFVTEASRAIGCDAAYVALPLMAGLASAVGNSRRVRLKRSWTEPMVLWTGIVGESGTQKSPAIDVALAPLKKIQSQMFEDYKSEKKKYDLEMDQFKEAERERNRNRSIPILARPEAPIAKRVLCSDITIEALAARLENAPRGLLTYRDELSGWISSFNQYKGGQ